MMDYFKNWRTLWETTGYWICFWKRQYIHKL